MAGFFYLLRPLYLTAYNFTLFVGWFQVLFIVLKTLKESGHENIYHAAEKPLLFSQSAAVLEILHGLVGLVRSPVTATLPQIGSRLFLAWGILWSFPETRTHVLVASLLISWSVTEIIRYFFFGLKEAFGSAPSWLLWLRYSTFLVLYPTGISSEVGLIYIALPFIKASEKYCIRMPNKWITFVLLLLCWESMVQVALTCIVTCLHRGRKLYQNQRKSRVAYLGFTFVDFYPNIGSILL